MSRPGTKRRNREAGHDCCDSLFDQERIVLARWDAGEEPEDIAISLGIATRRVDAIITLFDDCRTDEFRMARDAERGSRALAAAIVASGGRFA